MNQEQNQNQEERVQEKETQEVQKQSQKEKRRRISTRVGIGIITLTAVIIGGLIWQYSKTVLDIPEVEEREKEIKEELVTKKLFTIPEDHGNPSVIFSPNHKRFAYRVRGGEKEFMVLDGVEQEGYDLVGGFIFSPDSNRFAYIAKEGEKEFIILDGVGQKEYIFERPLLPDFIFSPDSNRFAYIAREGEKEFIVLDGKKLEEYDEIVRFSSVFSPDSKRFAYAARQRETGMIGLEFIVLDGVEQEIYNKVSSFVFSPDSKRFAYRAGNLIVLDGVEQERYDQVQNPVFSPDSKRFAYKANQGGIYAISQKNFIIIDSIEQEKYNYIYNTNSFLFSPDSNRFAYAVQQGGNLFIVLDKIEQKEKKYYKIHNLVFSPDSKRFAYVGEEMKEYSIVLKDGIEQNKYDGFISKLTFSPNSKHLAYIVRQNKKRFIVLNGIEFEKYDEIYNFSFSEDNRHLIYNAIDGRDIYLVVEEIKELNESEIEDLAVEKDADLVFVINWEKGEDYSNHIGSKTAEFKISENNIKRLSWPVVKNISNEEIIQKINEILDFDKNLENHRGLTFSEFDATNYNGIVYTNFNVNYDKNNSLSITFHVGSSGAYLSQFSFTKNIDINKGVLLSISDFTDKSETEILTILNNKLQLVKDNVIQELISQEEYNDYFNELIQRGEFTEEDLNYFRITDEGIAYNFNFGFPHAFRIFEPNGLITLTWDEL